MSQLTHRRLVRLALPMQIADLSLDVQHWLVCGFPGGYYNGTPKDVQHCSEAISISKLGAQI
jgi:hypothetical protein